MNSGRALDRTGSRAESGKQGGSVVRQLQAACLIFGLLAAMPALTGRADAPSLAPIIVDYPADGSVFPPEITPPAFLWRDAARAARWWEIQVEFGDGAPGIRVRAAAERPRI